MHPATLLLAAAPLFALSAQAQTASFELLPPEFRSVAAVSPDGGALVLDRQTADASRYAVWLDGVITPFTPPTCGEGYTPQVHHVSDDGVSTGWVRGLSPTSWVWVGEECRAATGADGGVVFLVSVTPDGAHAVGYNHIYASTPTERGGYLWTDGVGTYVPPPAGDHNRSLSLRLISDDGSTVYGRENSNHESPSRGFLIRDGAKTYVPASGDFATVGDLSADGAVALVFDHNGDGMGGLLPYVLEEGALTSVPLPPGASQGWPVAMSGDATRMAGYVQFGPDATVRDAVIWEGLVPRLLRDALADHGVDPDSIPPNLHVTHISTNGRVLVGRAQDGGEIIGVWRAVLPATAQWAEATDGFFDDADRWAPAVVPNSLTAVRLAATGGVHTVTFRRDEAVGSLTVGSPDAPLITFDLGAHTLALGPDVSPLVVGDAESGGLQLAGGALYVDGGAVLGRSGDARGILSLLDGHALTVDGRLTVGDGGTHVVGSGVLVFDGSVTTTGGMILGAGAGTSGLVSLFPGTSWQNTSEAATSIGFDGEGLLVANGAFVSHTGPVFLGAFEAGRGRIELEDASSMLTTDSLWIGLRGAGELLIASGSGLSTGPVVIGDRGGSVGSVRLTGAGSRWDIVGDVVVGDDGAAVLEVVEGAFLCLGGASRLGPQGRVVTDATVRIEPLVDCAALARESGRVVASGIRAGSLTLAAGATVEAAAVEVGPGGGVDGDGSLAVPLTSGGTLAPGGGGALGTLALAGPLTQTVDGTLAIEVGADAADAVTVAGAVTLGGTLRVTALDGEAPTVGQSHDVLTAGSHTGAFGRIEAPDGIAVTVSATAVTVTVTGPVDAEDGPAGELALGAPSPNPAAGSVTLAVSVPAAGPVRLAVYDALGREVRVLASGPWQAGAHEVVFDGSGLPAGVYLVRLRTPAGTRTQPVTVVR